MITKLPLIKDLPHLEGIQTTFYAVVERIEPEFGAVIEVMIKKRFTSLDDTLRSSA